MPSPSPVFSATESPAVAHCPALLITAPASGQGKTLVTAALARLLARQGKVVRVFKCGPDFLDPHWHALASGAPVQTLDLWMAGADDGAARLYAAACEADVILIEGVMGLFDGQPSAADLALRWNIPVMPVLQAGAMAQTCAAIAHGLRTFRPGLRWAGVLCSGVGGDHHASLLREALRPLGHAGDGEGAASTCGHTHDQTHDPLHDQWLGALPRLRVLDDAAPARTAGEARALGSLGSAFLPERHLGLIPAAEMQDALARLDQAADALAQTPLGQRDAAGWAQWQVAFAAPSMQSAGAATADAPSRAIAALPAAEGDGSGPRVPAAVPPWGDDRNRWLAAQRFIARRPLRGRTVAIARDAAFAFIYPANVQCLHDMGATLAWFSPLAGDALPACDAVWLPGGYPELHVQRLGAQTALRDALAEHLAQQRPIWAECGGMLALCEGIALADGDLHPLWGLLPGTARMQTRLAGLGPQQWHWAGAAAGPAAEHPAAWLRGHTFHYSRLESTAPVIGHTERPPHRRGSGVGSGSGARAGEAVYQCGSLRASYFHAWFPSSPQGVAWLLGGPGALDSLNDDCRADALPVQERQP
ncbi:MAG: cobyrinic acid a,c-diamide synthase [Comamonadaceae bacterium]|nr:cobyrinic acid a,c-diamide synthase [Comamonadaceae bacterium]